MNGRLFPVVQALEAASGVPRRATRSARARAVFTALGMRLVDLGPGTTSVRSRLVSGAHASPTATAASVTDIPAGGAWRRMSAQPGHDVAGLDITRLPSAPGVYAFYRDGKPVYVGRAIAAGGLRRRLSTSICRPAWTCRGQRFAATSQNSSGSLRPPSPGSGRRSSPKPKWLRSWCGSRGASCVGSLVLRRRTPPRWRSG